MGIQRSILTFILLIALPGCVGTINGDGVHWAVAGTYYGHSEEPEGGDNSSTWNTVAGRTWGTSGLEGEITSSKEKVSIQGKGISPAMAGVLGEDVVQKIGEIVSCALQPAQLGCAGIGGGD